MGSHKALGLWQWIVTPVPGGKRKIIVFEYFVYKGMNQTASRYLEYHYSARQAVESV